MQDRYGLVPSVIREEYERSEMVDQQLRSAAALFQALQALDPRLDLRYVYDRANPAHGVKPGRWHVVRKNDPPVPETFIPITTEDGGYREPDFGVLEELKRRDLWNQPLPLTKAEPSTKRKTDPLVVEQHTDALAEDLRAAFRVAGDGGLEKRKWGRK